MLLETWSAAIWLDESVIIAKWLADAAPPGQAVVITFSPVAWMWLGPGTAEGNEGSTWYSRNCIIYMRGGRGEQTG